MSQETEFFDCNASFGSPAQGTYRPCTTVEELLAEMDWAGVGRALVHHALMSDQSPVVGNRALAEAIAGQPRLAGTWAILPPQTRELPPSETFFAQMAAANVRALWAFPDVHRYILSRLTFGRCLDEVSARRIPLFLTRGAGGPGWPETWKLAHDLLSECSELTLVMAAHGPWGDDRFFRPLFDHYPNFYLDLSRYELDCGLAELVSLYGAERLLYGSNFPQNAMGGPRLMVARAKIDEEARAAVAGGNMARLLGEVQP